MKIAYISDTHADTWKRYDKPMKICQTAEDADIAIFAGDAGNGSVHYDEIMDMLRERYGRVLGVRGNHDYYHGAEDEHPTSDMGAPWTVEIDGVVFAGATLWSNFRDSVSSGLFAERCISDYRLIKQWDAATTLAVHDAQWQYLKDAKADVIVTHFPAFIESEHPDYAGDSANPYFVNDRDSALGAKVWIHGHTHNRFAYTKDGCWVVCNPVGYPGENQFEPVIIPRIIEL